MLIVSMNSPKTLLKCAVNVNNNNFNEKKINNAKKYHRQNNINGSLSNY